MKRPFYYIIFLLLLSIIGNSYSQEAATLKQEVRKIVYRVRLLKNSLQLIPNDNVRHQLRLRITTIQNELKITEDLLRQKRYQQALEHLRTARQLLNQIESFIIRQTRLNIQIRNTLDTKIKRAEKVLQESRNPYAHQLLEQAKLYRDKATTAYRQRSIFRAVEYFRLSDYFASRAIDLATQRTLDVQQLFQKARALLEEFQHSPYAKTREGRIRLHQLKRQLEQIKQLMDNGREATAHSQLKSLLFEIYQYFAPGRKENKNAQIQVTQRWKTLQRNLQEMSQKVSTSSDRVVRRLWQQTHNMAIEIENAIQRKSYNVARTKMDILVRLLYQLDKRLQGETPSKKNSGKVASTLKKDLAFTREAVERIRQDSDENNAPLIMLLHNLLQTASQQLRAQHYVQASYYLKIINQLILKYYQIRNTNESDKSVTAKDALQYLSRFEAVVQKLKRTGAQNPKLQAAERILQTAKVLYQKGNYQQVKAFSDYGLRMLTK